MVCEPGKTWQPALGAWASAEGIRFAVWAPQRTSIEVLLERPGQEPLAHPLEKAANGTFSGIHPGARVGDLYRYRVDEKNIYPDPASRFQPEGVHGPSQIIDPSHFKWSDAAWRGLPLEELILYELHVGTFTPEGTFEAVLHRLPHLLELGVTAIELMPLGDFPGLRNWGYDGVALFAPARCYGSPDDLRQLVNTAHRAGLAVLLDVVYNHLGPDGNYTGIFSPFYVTSRHPSPWGPGLNFDGEQSAGAREFFIQNALHWIHEYHFDGLRLDATHAMVDTRPRHFLAELTHCVQNSVGGRIAHVISEDNRNMISLVEPEEKGGMGLTAVWSDDFHHQVRKMLAGDDDGYYVDFTGRPDDLAETLRKGWFYSGQNSAFFKGPRGTNPGETPLEHFVFFIQNHDQIGNRAFGERLHHQVSAPEYRAASALLLGLPETPLLFMGQEWAASSPFLYFTDHDEELGKAVTEGRRKEFESFVMFAGAKGIPDPQSPDTFRRSKLVWSEKMNEPHESVWLFSRALVKLRREEFKRREARGEFAAVALGESSLAIRRFSPEGRRILILLQMKGAGVVDLSGSPFLPPADHEWDLVLSSEERAFCLDPQPPVIQVSGKAPRVEFARPGAVILKERPKAAHSPL